jgi:hypothetical protein
MEEEEPTAIEQCVSCGIILDDETAFRMTRAGRSYCCLCYLKHDIKGKPFNRPTEEGGGYVFSAPLATGLRY